MLIDRYALFRIYVENLSKSLQKYENSKMSSLSMRGIHALCLFQLGKHPEGMTASELSQACEVDKALISRVVAELLELSHIAHKNPQKTKYRSKLVLTDSGKACLRQVTHWVCDAIRDLKSEITSEELNAFFKVITILNRFLDEGAVEENSAKV
ncbi:MAG: winged helix-turn-helix transcriptional regulator [Clostridia bacterium]|nr:winged helix-turn-helix transcriptional regulator [Clostridia bacterium]